MFLLRKNLDSFILKDIKKDKLFDFLRDMEFNRLLSLVISFYGESETKDSSKKFKNSEKLGKKINTKNYECIVDEKNLDKWIKTLSEKEIIAVDTETSSLNALETNLVGISFSYGDNNACYIPLEHKKGKSLKKELVLKKIKPILEDSSIKKIGQNIKFDFIVLKKHGSKLIP